MAVDRRVGPDRTLRRVIWALWIAVGVLAAVALVLFFALRGGNPASGSSAAGEQPPASDAPSATWAAGAVRAPAFALQDERGAPVSLASLRGRPVLVTFIDPLCRDYCPTEAKRLTDAVASVPAAQRPAIVAVSVNVYGNAPHILRQDRAKWSLGPEWHWGVASQTVLARVWHAYHVEVLVSTKKIAGVEVHQIGHTEGSYLVDATGHERALFLWPYTAAAVARGLRALS